MSLGKENKKRLDALEKAAERTETRDVEDAAAGMSIRDRLMRRLEKTAVRTIIEDDLGEIVIETRMLTGDEWDEMSRLNSRIGEARGDIAVYRAAINEIRGALPEVTITPGIDWFDKAFTDDVVILTNLNTVLATSRKVVEGISKFRPE